VIIISGYIRKIMHKKYVLKIKSIEKIIETILVTGTKKIDEKMQ
jgi:hypothetical protein